MTQEELFSAAIGITKPWSITSISLDVEKGELNISVDFARGSLFEYIDPETGEASHHKAYDTATKRWRHMNFFQYRCYLNARIPRIKLGNGKVKQVKAPWEGNTSGFTMLFEALILQLSKVLPIHQVSQVIGSYDSKIWGILESYTEKARGQSDYSQVEDVGIDETSSRRGHSYVTLFVDLKQKRTLFVTEGKDSGTVAEFVDDLEKHKGKAGNIKYVSSDMSPAFIKGVGANLPNAELVFDKFHIIKIINEAVDAVRKEESQNNPILKNSRYVFLKNQNNFTVKQQEKYEEIKLSKLNIRTFKAMQIKEAFQQLYQAGNKNQFETLFNKWYFWATHCRIPQMIKVAKTIKKHEYGIVNWADKNINNGILEGFNSLFQAAKAKARGYKKTKTITTVIYILTGKFDFSTINPYCATHTFL